MTADLDRPAYEDDLPLGRLDLVPLDPDRHLDHVYGWVTEPRAEYWGMRTHTREQVREIYAFLAGLATHHAYLMRLDRAPVGIFQTYEPAADPVGECYPVLAGDLGIHLLLAPPVAAPVPGFTGAVVGSLFRHLFDHPGVRRLVIEPDLRNTPALRRWRRLGFEFGPRVELPGKTAHLGFLVREADPVRSLVSPRERRPTLQ